MAVFFFHAKTNSSLRHNLLAHPTSLLHSGVNQVANPSNWQPSERNTNWHRQMPPFETIPTWDLCMSTSNYWSLLCDITLQLKGCVSWTCWWLKLECCVCKLSLAFSSCGQAQDETDWCCNGLKFVNGNGSGSSHCNWCWNSWQCCWHHWNEAMTSNRWQCIAMNPMC